MLFSSISFIYYFLPIVIIAYFLSPNKIKNFTLFVSSMIFYFYGEPIYILVMISTIFFVYIFALLIEKYKETKAKKIFFILGILVPLGSLIIFKYYDFGISNINKLLHTNLKLLKLTMPIGISFYTFQLLSYIIDVYKRKSSSSKKLFKTCNIHFFISSINSRSDSKI